MSQYKDKQETDESEAGGCYAKDVHNEIRTKDSEIGGKENPTEKLMRPQTDPTGEN